MTLSFSRDRAAIEALLRRAPVEPDHARIEASLHDAVVLVTGAGGSIGSELSRHICRYRPARLVLVERHENGLFEIHRQLVHEFPTLSITPCVADICDAPRMLQVFDAERPAVVFHAAAHKHVALMEANPGEAIKNNVGGTRTVADLADRFSVDRFVLISTDKAVDPTSIMGATKRIAELYTLALAQRSNTRFVTVRFGNVLGSKGSVLAIFLEQIARGGPVTVTHPDMQRYFMTMSEACQLVLQAAVTGAGGMFALDMGAPIKIVDLARDLIALSGRRPDEIAIEFIGARPGEKLVEASTSPAEPATMTSHPRVFVGHDRPAEWTATVRGIEALLVCGTESPLQVGGSLLALVPEFRPAQLTPTERS